MGGVAGVSNDWCIINLFERAFKMMKNSIYLVEIALLVIQDFGLCKSYHGTL